MSNSPAPSIPLTVKGPAKDLVLNQEILYWYPWLKGIAGTDTYVHLHAQWQVDKNSDQPWPESPPTGYTNYIISGDSLMVGWAELLSQQLDANIIQLFQSYIPDDFTKENTLHFTYNTAHLRGRRLANRLGPMSNKNIRYKASALTRRISQSKIIIFSAMKEILGDHDAVYSLHKVLRDEKNIHSWQTTGNATCDHYMHLFRTKWANSEIKLPWDDHVMWTYDNPAYVESAINFTQESYHYSYTHNAQGCFIQPGPFLTEKTWKCILSETAFIPVGQYFSYHWLQKLGFQFDYGALDLSFDNDPGNLTRLEKIVDLIRTLADHSAQDLFDMTRDSTVYNKKHLLSDNFIDACQQDNQPFYDFLSTLK